MKTLLSFALSFLFLIAISAQSVEPQIKDIRTQFKWINSQDNFTKVELYENEFTDYTPDNGADLTGFYRENTLYKIIENYGVSFAWYTTEYYFKNNELIFVYRVEKTIEKDENLPKYEERVYYHDNKIIRHLKKNAPLSGQTYDFQQKSQELRLMLDAKQKYVAKYTTLEGLWKNQDSEDDWFEIQGATGNHFEGSDFKYSFRIVMRNHSVIFHNIEENIDTTYEILKLTDDIFEIQNKLTGEHLRFQKKKD